MLCDSPVEQPSGKDGYSQGEMRAGCTLISGPIGVLLCNLLLFNALGQSRDVYEVNDNLNAHTNDVRGSMMAMKGADNLRNNSILRCFVIAPSTSSNCSPHTYCTPHTTCLPLTPLRSSSRTMLIQAKCQRITLLSSMTRCGRVHTHTGAEGPTLTAERQLA